MSRSHRWLLGALVVVVGGTWSTSLGADGRAEDRITASANVTMRGTPSAGGVAVAQLPLGTEVSDAGPLGMDKTWVRVRVADGREGWVLANLTRPLDPVWRCPTFDRVIAERLSRKGDGFAASVELVAFIDRVHGEYTDRDGRARIELARARALAAALGTIPFQAGRREPYASFIAAQGAAATYDEPGGRWMLADRSIWDLEERHVVSPVADEIAWFAVTNGLGGECEGFVPCYFVWRNRLQGEYLRRHPAGQHAGDAVSTIKDLADRIGAPGLPSPSWEFNRDRDCKALVASIDALTRAVQPTRVPSHDGALSSLATLKRVCQ